MHTHGTCSTKTYRPCQRPKSQKTSPQRENCGRCGASDLEQLIKLNGNDTSTVLDDRQTGETILDEALKMMKGQQDPVAQGGGGEKMSVNNWIDLLSGKLNLAFSSPSFSYFGTLR